MSKLIVEMAMPRNCEECAANHDCAFCGITGSVFYGNTQMPNFMPDEQILPDCPIVGVLPDEHGDLIDRDKAKDAFDSSFLTFRMKDGETMRGFYQRTIAELPTVIAAERKDDDKDD